MVEVVEEANELNECFFLIPFPQLSVGLGGRFLLMVPDAVEMSHPFSWLGHLHCILAGVQERVCDFGWFVVNSKNWSPGTSKSTFRTGCPRLRASLACGGLTRNKENGSRNWLKWHAVGYVKNIKY